MTKNCIGCGIRLQTTNKDLPGYIPSNKIETSSYCERCFRLTHYNEYKEVDLKNINNIILERLNKDRYLTFFLIDFLNINSETISSFKKIDTNKILVISKKDIIPKSIKEEKITNFIKKEYKIYNDIIYLSSKSNYNITKITNYAKKYNTTNIYIAGYTNSGKSTLINSLLKNNNMSANITTSSIPNTTLDFLKIEIDNITIIDTPGFILEQNIYKSKEYDLIRRTNPKSYLKPITYQTKEITGILIENKIYISTDKINSLTLYLSNNLNYKKVYNNPLNKKELIKFNINNNTDLVLKGLGFINIKKASTVSIYSDYKEIFEIRNSIFRGDNNE